MLRRRFLLYCGFLLPALSVSLWAADTALVGKGRDLIMEMAYDKAVPVLEEALAGNPQDASAAGLLAMAYLYSAQNLDQTRNVEKAETTYIKALDLGGSANFLVSLAKDKVKGPNVLKAESGTLTMYRDRVEFVRDRNSTEDHIFLGGGDLKECGHSGYGKSSNTVYLKTRKGEYHFRPHHFSREEGNVVCKLVAKYFGAKTEP